MLQCKCNKIIPQGRVDLGYTVCVDCSTTEQYGCAPLINHKTGNSIQIMSCKPFTVASNSSLLSLSILFNFIILSCFIRIQFVIVAWRGIEPLNSSVSIPWLSVYPSQASVSHRAEINSPLIETSVMRVRRQVSSTCLWSVILSTRLAHTLYLRGRAGVVLYKRS